MKATIENGILLIEPDTRTEAEAFNYWWKENVHQCAGEAKRGSVGMKTKSSEGTQAIIKFCLPEDYPDLLRTVKATDMAAALFEIQRNLWRKFEDVEEDECEASWYTFLKEINTLLEESGINVDELNA